MNQFTRVAYAIAGSPVEILYRIFRFKWQLDKQYSYSSPDGSWSLTAELGMCYDSFTYAPNLRKEDGSKSDAAPLHDKGWVTGKKDDGTILTFDENNAVFRHVLEAEEHPEWIINLYEKGVSASFMRKRWEQTHGHK